MSKIVVALMLLIQAPTQPPTTTAAAAPEPADAILARMLSLYDEICLKTFPNDRAIDALMETKGAKPLSPDEVKITLRDDPGRGWLIQDGGRTIQVMLELPPYHACSVRRMTPAGFADLARYDALASDFKATRPGFAPINPLDMPMGELQVHATGEGRTLSAGGSETLLIYHQRLRPGTKGAEQSLVNVRFVHQIVSPDAR